VVKTGISEAQNWNVLWEAVQDELISSRVSVSVIPMQPWFQELLKTSQFEQFNNVVVLTWDWNPSTIIDSNFTWLIREMLVDDLSEVKKVDASAFNPVWQIPAELLKDAFNQAAIATVAEIDGKIAGYQISTANPEGGHLARLAVDPDIQNQGVGTALVQNMLTQFHQLGALKVTVNTQTDKLVSLALYKKNGLQRTNEVYPVYRMD